MSPIDRTLAALADPTRRGVIDLLRRGPRRAGELAAALSVRPPALSRHLKVLKASGLVSEAHPAEDARARVFTLQQAPFDELRSWIEEVETYWAGQLEAFRRHAERRRRP